MSYWKDKLMVVDTKINESVDHLYQQHKENKKKDMGLVNPNNGSGLMVRENGDIEAFAGLGLGFRMSRSQETLSVFAPEIKVFSENIRQMDKEEASSFFKDETEEALKLMTGK